MYIPVPITYVYKAVYVYFMVTLKAHIIGMQYTYYSLINPNKFIAEPKYS